MTTTTFNASGLNATRNSGKTSLLSLARLAIAARRQRAALRNLDDAALCDLGLTRAQATAEAARSPWDVPANWLR